MLGLFKYAPPPRRLSRNILAILVLFAGATHAGTILFSDLGTGSSLYAGGVEFSGSAVVGAGGQVSDGFAFTPSITALLTQIDVVLIYNSGRNSALLTLYSDTAGVPGTALDAWSLSNLPACPTTSCTLETVTPHSAITLLSGTQYWLIASTVAADTLGTWGLNTTGTFGGAASSTNGAAFTVISNYPLGAFDVIGTTVPEPATFALAAAGLALCLARKKMGPAKPAPHRATRGKNNLTNLV